MEKAIACIVDKSIRVKRQRELTEAEEENISKMEQPTEGPHEIKEVYRNGVVKIRRGNYAENIHMRRLKPFYE